ncbi:MAG: hypothetical protein KDA84_02545 [Planctomycetaceae bacterium]|nr:hypothetical protein [Planctomycetaceae bacterium]
MVVAAMIVAYWFVKTDYGTLTIKSTSDFKLELANQVVKIRDIKTGREYKVQINQKTRLPSGEYQFLVEDSEGLRVETNRFQIKRGDQELLVEFLVPTFDKTSLPISQVALTTTPLQIPGLKTWTLETRYHRGNVYLLAASPDGKHIATAGQDCTIRIWDAETMEPEQILYMPSAHKKTGAMAWSRDGKKLACVGGNEVIVYETNK